MRKDRLRAVFAIPVVCMSLLGCAHAQKSASAADFSGNWSVKWCDKTAPEADCGGFFVELKQQGDLLSGESYGARVRLAQIDEGGVVHGLTNGQTAVLTVESGRSGAIYLVQASIDGDCMHWTMRDTVRPAERDIDIVAFDDVLTRAGAVNTCPQRPDEARQPVPDS